MNLAETIQLVPNCSLQPRSAVLFFVGLCTVSFTIGAVLALHGLWPILPFCGLEMAALGWALHLSMRRRHYTQTIIVTEDRVEIRTFTRGGPQQVEFPRHWAQVKLRGADTALHPSRLTIESRGHAFEVGSFLTEEERRALAKRLTGSIGRMNQSPPLHT